MPSSNQWNYVEVDNAFYEEERTAGRGLRKVLNAMAPVKKVVLEALSEVTPSDILDAGDIETEIETKSPARVSKHVPLEYGELNFYSTRPKKDNDIHITKERATLIEPETPEEKNDEPSQSLEIISQQATEDVKSDKIIEEPELKKADFLFNEFAKIEK